MLHTRRDLIEGGFFFAMRVHKFAKAQRKGKTKHITLGNISFWDRMRVILSQLDPKLEEKAYFVTITFVDQKNRKKMDRRTQQATKERVCPARAQAWVC